MPALPNLHAALGAVADNAGPIRRHLFAVFTDSSDAIPSETLGDTDREKILYTVFSAIPLLLTCYLFWRRLRTLSWQDIQHLSYIRCLVYASYINGIAFLATAITLTGTGVETSGECRTAIYFCIGFLYVGKIFMQVFLIERAHVANVNYLRRRDDPIWIASTLIAFFGGAFLATWAFLNPVAFIAKSDGRCRKGIPTQVVAPLEIFEFVLNTVLTTVFVVMIRRTRQLELFPKVPEQFPTVRGAFRRMAPKQSGKESRSSVADTPLDVENIILPPSSKPSRLHSLAYRSLIGTIAILTMSIITSAIFYVTDGKEHMALCFGQCTGDIFLSICVLHWLTTNPSESEGQPRTRLSVCELPTFLREDSVTEEAQTVNKEAIEKVIEVEIRSTDVSSHPEHLPPNPFGDQGR